MSRCSKFFCTPRLTAQPPPGSPNVKTSLSASHSSPHPSQPPATGSYSTELLGPRHPRPVRNVLGFHGCIGAKAVGGVVVLGGRRTEDSGTVKPGWGGGVGVPDFRKQAGDTGGVIIVTPCRKKLKSQMECKKYIILHSTDVQHSNTGT